MYRFGFDLGTTSVGWAVLRVEGDVIVDLVDAGVRVFKEPRDPKTSESNAVSRRKARALRRMYRRRQSRRSLLMRRFKEFEWLDPTLEPPYGFSSNPYSLRAAALSRLLSPQELSEVFFHLGKRRGFKSNRKSNKKSDDSQLLVAANELMHAIKSSGCATLGSYLNSLYVQNPLIRLRNKKTLRKMYEDEFDLIVQRQRDFGSEYLSDERASELRRIIFYQLPFELQPEKRLVQLGDCRLELGQKRALRSHPVSARYRIVKSVNNLKWRDPFTTDLVPLSYEDRAVIIRELWENPKKTFDQIRKLFDRQEEFNLETSRNSSLKGCIESAALIYAYGDQFSRLSFNDQVKVIVDLQKQEDVDSFSRVLSDVFGAVPESCGLEKLLVAFSDSDDGTASYSVAAMEKILRYLENGLNEYEAIQSSYGNLSIEDSVQKLPLPVERITNPTVNRAIHQFRRVMNALVGKYGKPSSVVFELARDLKRSKKEREFISNEQKKREKDRERKRQILQNLGVTNPSRFDILKFELWDEQGGVCPYTGESISAEGLFSSNRYEIDHILPFSRTLDDSRFNLVVVQSGANAEKGNRTPGEWLNGTVYDEMISRVSLMKKMPFHKRRRFNTNSKAELDDFLPRQLNDTKYISKYVKKYVSLIFEPDARNTRTIQACKGAHTAWLRKLWGLNRILSVDGEDKKNREDLRHHALDAIVIGATTPSNLQILARSRGHYGQNFNLKCPFPTFAKKVEAILKQVIVSRKSSGKLSGALHEETSRSLPIESSARKVATKKRVSLNAITLSQVQSIVDVQIKKLVLNRLKENGAVLEDSQSVKKAISEGALSDLTMESGVPIFKVRIIEECDPRSIVRLRDKRTGEFYRSVQKGSNYSLDLLEVANERKPLKVKINPLYDVVTGEEEPDKSRADLIFTLKKGDAVQVKGLGVSYVRNISLTASGGPYIEFDSHTSVGCKEKSERGTKWERITNVEDLQRDVRILEMNILGKVELNSWDE